MAELGHDRTVHALLGDIASRQADGHGTVAPARGPAKPQVLVDRRLHVRRFKFDPIGVIGQPARLGELARPRRGIAAGRQE